MSKRGGNHPMPGYFSVQGKAVEDRDAARMSKQALGAEKSRRRRRAGAKTRLGEAPPEQHVRERPSARAAKKTRSKAAAGAKGSTAKTAAVKTGAVKTGEAAKPAAAKAAEAAKSAAAKMQQAAKPVVAKVREAVKPVAAKIGEAGNAAAAKMGAPAKPRKMGGARDEGMELPAMIGGRMRRLARGAVRMVSTPVAVARAVVDLFRRNRD